MSNPAPVNMWKTGQSGNPSGLSRSSAAAASAVQAKAQSLCEEALGVLATVMRGEGLDKSVAHLQLTAAGMILDRGVGRAAQAIIATLNIEKRLAEMTTEELVELRERYRALPKPVVIDAVAEDADT
jgi:hypothetical protein